LILNITCGCRRRDRIHGAKKQGGRQVNRKQLESSNKEAHMLVLNTWAEGKEGHEENYQRLLTTHMEAG